MIFMSWEGMGSTDLSALACVISNAEVSVPSLHPAPPQVKVNYQMLLPTTHCFLLLLSAWLLPHMH
jgi:hypothetical protein